MITQDVNVGKEEYVKDSDESMIVIFQSNQLHTHSRTVINDGRYTDTNILVDNKSICSVFKSSSMLLDIRGNNQMLRAYTNGVHQDSKIVGDFPEFFKVWYIKVSMVNKLSVSDIHKKSYHNEY